ncbi:hypothetical protein ACMFMG_012096 [Clarireedia jacksonii]
MSASDALLQHLERVELSGSEIDVILSKLGEWLLNAKFDLDRKVDKCIDTELHRQCLPLFIELDKLKKIRSPQARKYNVIRIHSQDPVEFGNSVGETDLIPIRVIEGDPVVSNATSDSTPYPSQRLNPGSITHITKDVTISSALHCFIVIITY